MQGLLEQQEELQVSLDSSVVSLSLKIRSKKRSVWTLRVGCLAFTGPRLQPSPLKWHTEMVGRLPVSKIGGA